MLAVRLLCAHSRHASLGRRAWQVVCSQGGSRGKVTGEQQRRGEVFQPRSVRAMPIRLISVSRGGSAPLEEAANEYAARIKNYTVFDEVVVKPNPKNTTDPILQKEAEGERVAKLIAAGSRVVMLDERGKDLTSEGLANLLAKAGDDGVPVVFVIGGPFGHGPQVQERADMSVRLSTMVMNHQVARLVLLEQIYRAWTIIKGEPYHH